MFYIRYVLAELRRRKGRTLLTAMGLGVGVGLVVAVSALSAGLDKAQDKVLEPLTGVGTDMSVTRPLTVSGSGDNQSFGGGLSQAERDKLREENGPGRFRLDDLGDPGDKFSTEQFVTGQQLTFGKAEIEKIKGIDGVQSVSGALTVTALKISGTVPERSDESGGVQRGQGGPSVGAAPGPPNSINTTSSTVTGIDASQPDIAPVTESQVSKGKYLSADGSAYQALVNVSYARQNDLKVGDKFDLGGKKFTVVGLTTAPLGGTSSDYYVKLATLQKLSDRAGRINTMQVRAASSGDVAAVQKSIESAFDGASVTTAQELADRVGGSLKDAKSLSDKLGVALAAVALIAAFLIATLLTLSGVAKRTRELGTLKALGWRQRLVVRQVTAESLAQGLLGGVFGAIIGIGAAGLITAFGPELKATVAAQSSGFGAGGFGRPGGGGPIGAAANAITSGSQVVKLSAPVDLGLIALAIGLALLGGLLAGVVGGARAARLRPAEALRSVE